MLKNLRKGIGIVGIIALVALAFTFGCSDSDYSEPETTPDGKTFYTGTIDRYNTQAGVVTEIQVIDTANAQEGKAGTRVIVTIPAGTALRLENDALPEDGVNVVLEVSDKGASGYENAIATVTYNIKDLNDNQVVTASQPLNFCIQLEEGAANPGQLAYIFKDVGGQPTLVGTQTIPSDMVICVNQSGTSGTFYITIVPTGSSGGTT